MIAAPEIPTEFSYTQDTDTRFSSDTDFSEDPDGRNYRGWKDSIGFFFKVNSGQVMLTSGLAYKNTPSL
uniref:Uncharacterized protein n=1 Tax=Seriola lalandi dorsalis TaxID=1841481 RepID=A0A3B4YU70_SERLL